MEAGPLATSANPEDAPATDAPSGPRTVLGLLGGIGTGKSHVARRTAALSGGRLVDADTLAHAALETFARDGQLADALGAEFVRDGRPDVPLLASKAFADPALLQRLERLVHPPVHAAIKAALDEFRAGAAQGQVATGAGALLILDVPLLIEVGLDRQCDALWYIDVPDEVRAERAARRGLTLQQIHQREAFQSPRERKRARADLSIQNDVAPEALDSQILAGLETLGLKPSNPTLGEPSR